MDVCPRYLLSNQIPFEIGSTKCDPALTCFLPSHSFASHVSFWDDKKRKLVQQNVRNHTSWCKQWWDGINKVFILSEELGTISVYGKRYHLTQTAILFKYGMFFPRSQLFAMAPESCDWICVQTSEHQWPKYTGVMGKRMQNLVREQAFDRCSLRCKPIYLRFQ